MFEETEKKMKEAVAVLQDDLSSLRTSRANPSLIENILVEAYEGAASLKLKEVATLAVEGARTILVEPWDKSLVGKVSKALEKANQGFNVASEGGRIRVTIPPLSLEQRQEYIRLMRRKVEATKVIIRHLRGEERGRILEAKEKGEISEDEAFRQEKELQDLTDKYIEQVDNLGKNKEKELLAV